VAVAALVVGTAIDAQSIAEPFPAPGDTLTLRNPKRRRESCTDEGVSPSIYFRNGPSGVKPFE